MSYFEIVNQKEEEGQVQYHIKVNAAHPVYKGHFPGNPIMPGVVQLQIITELLSHYLGYEVMLTSARALKFLNVINPEHVQELDVTLKTSEKEGEIRVNALGSFKEQKYFKLNGTFGSC